MEVLDQPRIEEARIDIRTLNRILLRPLHGLVSVEREVFCI